MLFMSASLLVSTPTHLPGWNCSWKPHTHTQEILFKNFCYSSQLEELTRRRHVKLQKIQWTDQPKCISFALACSRG